MGLLPRTNREHGETYVSNSVTAPWGGELSFVPHLLSSEPNLVYPCHVAFRAQMILDWEIAANEVRVGLLRGLLAQATSGQDEYARLLRESEERNQDLLDTDEPTAMHIDDDSPQLTRADLLADPVWRELDDELVTMDEGSPYALAREVARCRPAFFATIVSVSALVDEMAGFINRALAPETRNGPRVCGMFRDFCVAMAGVVDASVGHRGGRDVVPTLVDSPENIRMFREKWRAAQDLAEEMCRVHARWWDEHSSSPRDRQSFFADEVPRFCNRLDAVCRMQPFEFDRDGVRFSVLDPRRADTNRLLSLSRSVRFAEASTNVREIFRKAGTRVFRAAAAVRLEGEERLRVALAHCTMMMAKARLYACDHPLQMEWLREMMSELVPLFSSIADERPLSLLPESTLARGPAVAFLPRLNDWWFSVGTIGAEAPPGALAVPVIADNSPPLNARAPAAGPRALMIRLLIWLDWEVHVGKKHIVEVGELRKHLVSRKAFVDIEHERFLSDLNLDSRDGGSRSERTNDRVEAAVKEARDSLNAVLKDAQPHVLASRLPWEIDASVGDIAALEAWNGDDVIGQRAILVVAEAYGRIVKMAAKLGSIGLDSWGAQMKGMAETGLKCEAWRDFHLASMHGIQRSLAIMSGGLEGPEWSRLRCLEHRTKAYVLQARKLWRRTWLLRARVRAKQAWGWCVGTGAPQLVGLKVVCDSLDAMSLTISQINAIARAEGMPVVTAQQPVRPAESPPRNTGFSWVQTPADRIGQAAGPVTAGATVSVSSSGSIGSDSFTSSTPFAVAIGNPPSLGSVPETTSPGLTREALDQAIASIEQADDLASVRRQLERTSSDPFVDAMPHASPAAPAPANPDVEVKPRTECMGMIDMTKPQLIVLKVKPSVSKSELNVLLGQLRTYLESKGMKDFVFAIVPEGVSIEAMSDSDLNKIGLFRFDIAKAIEDSPPPKIEKEEDFYE